MNLTALWVVAGGAALAAGVNFYVFSSRREAVAAPPAPVAPAVAEEPEREADPPLPPGADPPADTTDRAP